MTAIPTSPSGEARPDLSLVMPCYNEDAIVGHTIPRLITAFEKAGHRLELVAVDNGSWDRTGEIIKELAAQNPSVIHHGVEKNEGYGNGVLRGIPICTADWIGIIPADGQVDADDVVRLYETVATIKGNVVAKARRRFRMDGMLRKIVSVAYNVFVRVLWPGLRSIDVNGTPKILPREVLLAMNLKSKGWFLDPEIMIKSHYMRVRVLEFNVFARMRGSGLSHVGFGTCWEFFRTLLVFRFSRAWRQDLKHVPIARQDALRKPEKVR